jgi:hypothetical protein
MELDYNTQEDKELVIDAICAIKQLTINQEKTEEEENFLNKLITTTNQTVLDHCWKHGYKSTTNRDFFRLADKLTNNLQCVNQEWRNYLLTTTDLEDQSLSLLLKKLLMKECDFCEQEFIPVNKKYKHCLECREDNVEED